VRLILLHPEVAFRSCDDCRKHIYNEQTGKREEHRGLPIVRPPGTFPPCQYGPNRCPKEHPDAGYELTPDNLQVYQHYLECKATGRFPDDPLVARNAGVIRLVEDAVERGRTEAMRQAMLASIGARLRMR
jgi:hypothetical protein